MNILLSIAGSDVSSGAGIQADLKTALFQGVHCLTVITAITSQNSLGVETVFPLPAGQVKDQLEVILRDIKPDVTKIGMASNAGILFIISNMIEKYKLKKIVLDPVLFSKNNVPLLDEKGVEFLKNKLLSTIYLLTPNLKEAQILTGIDVKDKPSMKKACKVLHEKGVQNILIKGGHLEREALDILYNGRGFYEFKSEKIKDVSVHGTGCIFSSAVASELAKGKDLFSSVKSAKDYVYHGIVNSFPLGKGYNFFNHFI